ncbi:MAG: hypothetical protein WBX01_11765 [Nitrososphaeraceae archaeon]|jgi:hypothetical protein
MFIVVKFSKVINPSQDPDKGESEYLAHSSTKVGVYQKPLAIVKRDDLGNIIPSKMNGRKAMFYIKFEPNVGEKILDEFRGECKGYVLAVAVNNGTESWYGSKFTITSSMCACRHDLYYLEFRQVLWFQFILLPV